MFVPRNAAENQCLSSARERGSDLARGTHAAHVESQNAIWISAVTVQTSCIEFDASAKGSRGSSSDHRKVKQDGKPTRVEKITK